MIFALAKRGFGRTGAPVFSCPGFFESVLSLSCPKFWDRASVLSLSLSRVKTETETGQRQRQDRDRLDYLSQRKIFQNHPKFGKNLKYAVLQRIGHLNTIKKLFLSF
jgi:hypothetical protein